MLGTLGQMGAGFGAGSVTAPGIITGGGSNTTYYLTNDAGTQNLTDDAGANQLTSQ